MFPPPTVAQVAICFLPVEDVLRGIRIKKKNLVERGGGLLDPLYTNQYPKTQGRFSSLPWDLLYYYTMILQRIGIIEGDAGFEPRASAPEVCCATNEPPHLQMSHHISRNSLHPPPLSYSAALPLVGPLCVGDTVWDTLSSEKLTQCRYIYSIYIYTVYILYIYCIYTCV